MRRGSVNSEVEDVGADAASAYAAAFAAANANRSNHHAHSSWGAVSNGNDVPNAIILHAHANAGTANSIRRHSRSSSAGSGIMDGYNAKTLVQLQPLMKLQQQHDAQQNSGTSALAPPPAYNSKPRFLNCLVLGSAIPFSIPFSDASLPVSSLTFSISAMLSALGLNLNHKRPLELFLVNNRSATNPTLLPTDSILHPSNPAFAAITSSMHEEDVVERTVVLLAGRCMWVNGAMKSAALRDLIDMEAVGGIGVDVLVLVPTDPRAAMGSATTPSSGLVVGRVGSVAGAVSVIGHRPSAPPRRSSLESFQPMSVAYPSPVPPMRSVSVSTGSNVLTYGNPGGTLRYGESRNPSIYSSYQPSYQDARGLVADAYPYPPRMPSHPVKLDPDDAKRKQMTVRRILFVVGAVIVVAMVLAVVAVVVSRKQSQTQPASSATGGTTAKPTPNANCKTTLFDDFTRPNTNNVGLITGSGGDIQALAWSTNLTFFPSGYTGYYYENIRDVIIAANGTTTTCRAAPSFGKYLAFSMGGSGTFHINLQVGCSKAVHVSTTFNVTTPPMDFVVDVDKVAGVNASADLSAVVWENMVFADKGVTWSLGNFRGVSDINDCALTGASMIP